MPERIRGPDQIWITRSHLLALGATTVCIALLTFFIGVRVGRTGVATAPDVPPPLVGAAEEGERLDALLQQVAGREGTEDLGFPSELPVGGATPTGLRAPRGDVPSGGWAIEVARYASVEEADARLNELQAGGTKSYRVTVIADGQRSFRVRIGGFATEKEASTALPGLEAALGPGTWVVVPAP